MQKLLEAIRKACTAEKWSRGVEIARASGVERERADQESVVVRIVPPAGMQCPSVTLWPEDGDWECSCPARARGCEHAAAAAIALRREEEGKGAIADSGASTGRVGYRFARARGGLALDRVIAARGRDHRIEASLAAAASGKLGVPRFAASQPDLAAELALGTHRGGLLPRHLVGRVLAALARCEDVELDGEPVRASPAPLGPLAVLEDQDEGFRLSIGQDPAVIERFPNGAALRDGTLHPFEEPKLTARESEGLAAGRSFGPDEVALLVTDVLPSLHGKIRIEVRTERLPGGASIVPRISLDAQRDGNAIEVLATIVYGDPPCARVDAGRIVHLGGPIPLRDERQEKVLVTRLGRQLDLAPGIRARFEGAAAVAFAEKLRGWGSAAARRDLEHFRREPPVKPRLVADRDRFSVEFEVPSLGGSSRGGGARADAASVLRAWRSGESLVPLLGGGFSPLPSDWLERHGEQVADLLAAREPSGRLPASALPDLARLCDNLGEPRPADLGKLAALVDGFEGLPEPPLPADLSVRLRGYQKQGVAWLSFLADAGLGALLADDMGLGKTIQALCAIRGRTLVVAPTSVLHNWREEIRRFRPSLLVSVYHGDRRALGERADVTLTTYAVLRLDAERLQSIEWDTVVLDEAQAIKNPDSRTARASYGLPARFRIALTGTPVENRLEELWSQIHFLNRGLLGGREDFLDRYARPIGEGEPGAAARLRERIRPFLLRRLKREVAPELPPRTEVELRCQLSPEEREVYDTVRAATLREVVERLRAGGGVLAALEALLRLRQAACHVGLVPGREAASSSKVALLLEVLEEVLSEGHKALVFSQWTSFLDRVEPHLRAAAIPFDRLDGTTRDREAVIRRFQEDGGAPVLLVSLKAGGTGLNLTAADHVFLLDPWWNPAVEDQAADRAHRIGQDRPVLVYRLVAEETVEERMLALKAKKRELAAAALGEAGRAAALSREDLLALLE